MRRLTLFAALSIALVSIPVHAAAPGAPGLRVRAFTEDDRTGPPRSYKTTWVIKNTTNRTVRIKLCSAYVWDPDNPEYEYDRTAIFRVRVRAHKRAAYLVRWRSADIYNNNGGPLGTRVTHCRTRQRAGAALSTTATPQQNEARSRVHPRLPAVHPGPPD